MTEPENKQDVILLDWHQQDNRFRIARDQANSPALNAAMGGGGNNVPLIAFRKVRRAKSKDDFETWQETNVANTLNLFDVGDVRSTTVVLEKSNEPG